MKEQSDTPLYDESRLAMTPLGVVKVYDPLEEFDSMDMPNDDIVVETPPCTLCEQRSTVSMTTEQYERMIKGGEPVQKIFPTWSADLRELLITGTHQECWDEITGGEE